ncbi:hypothetical protein R80B4_02565 [Fibrobacteres bacterium R8-0-B4]
MTLKFFKSVKSAVVLAGIAGVLLFAGGAWAGDAIGITSVTVDNVIRTAAGVEFTLLETQGGRDSGRREVQDCRWDGNRSYAAALLLYALNTHH